MRPGLRFVEEKSEFVFRHEWIEEDERIGDKERTMREVLKAMNSVNMYLKFTMEHESDFKNGRLPALSFEVWSEKEGVRHSYYEKRLEARFSQ